MRPIKSEVIILGAGLTGLTLARLLTNYGITNVLVEARDRLGGRIMTSKRNNTAPVELGATWLGKQHTYLFSLLEELSIGVFEQKLNRKAIYEPFSTSPAQLVQLPSSDSSNYRIKGGTDQLINNLSSNISRDSVFKNQAIHTIKKQGDIVLACSDTVQFRGNVIVSTLPPQLFTHKIKVIPTLPDTLIEVANKTHTWMGKSIKVALTFNDCFWDSQTLSGTIFSNVGPITEMYDHSNHENSLFALKGFMNGNYHGITKQERLQLVLRQLEKYYGSKVLGYTSYREKVWKNEKFTTTNSDEYILPHQNNGHDVYQQAYWDGSLFIAGSETSNRHGGYMEGAIFSAATTADKIIAKHKSIL